MIKLKIIAIQYGSDIRNFATKCYMNFDTRIKPTEDLTGSVRVVFNNINKNNNNTIIIIIIILKNITYC